MRQAGERISVPLLAACLMPNHLHLVVRPNQDSDLSRWTHWLFTTHVNHYHRKHGTCGRVWQDRFKAFVIEEDNHLLAVLRYVERNALRAGLVNRAEDWRWGSLRWRSSCTAPVTLHPSPVPLPADWTAYVNEPQTAAEIEAIRACVNCQRPFGSRGWIETQARDVGPPHSP
jgi:putative transposase